MASVHVVNLVSLSYAGTTWVNMVLGSHADALAIGPPDRAWRLRRKDRDKACMVHRSRHGDRCPVWRPFLRQYDARRNFFVQLADFTGRRYIVINNPPDAMYGRELAHPEIAVHSVRVVRDGRANLASFLHHDADRFANAYEGAVYLRRGWENLLALTPPDPGNAITLRYEDLVADPTPTLARVGEVLDLTYADNAIRYWEYDHHLVDGNTAAIDLLQRLQGRRGMLHQQGEFYAGALENLERQPDRPVVDERWKTTWSRVELAAFDLVAGELHAGFGYERDQITAEETRACIREFAIPLFGEPAPPPTPVTAAVGGEAPRRPWYKRLIE